MNSLWEETAAHLTFGSLNEDIKTDVLIIGGGICGVLCAYMLHQAGIDYALVEAEELTAISNKRIHMYTHLTIVLK